MEEPTGDPASMTPHMRRQESAAILVRGLLRLRQAGQHCDRRADCPKEGPRRLTGGRSLSRGRGVNISFTR